MQTYHMHGIDILRNYKNIKYSKSLKEEIVNQILIYNQSVTGQVTLNWTVVERTVTIKIIRGEVTQNDERKKNLQR